MKKTQLKFHGCQGPYFKAGPQPTLFLGGVGSGKTYVGILKLLALLDEYPGSRGVIIRQRFSQLKKTTAATLRQLLPREQIARRNDNEGLIVLKNGSELLLMHLDKADSIDNLKSLELNFAYVDQMEDISAEAWDTLLERLGRWSGATRRGGFPDDWPYRTEEGSPVPPAYAFASAYSPGFGHWITNRWWKDGDDRDKYRKQGYIVYIGSTRDNPNLTKGYIKSRLSMGKEYVERFVDAISWGAAEGMVFDLLPDSVVEPTEDVLNYLNRCKLHRVLDPGDFSPTACLWYATDHDGNVIFYREYQKENLLVSQHRQNIYDLSKIDFNEVVPRYESDVADPVIVNKTRGRNPHKAPQWSVQDEWSERSVQPSETSIFWRPANNDESMTVTRVREYMRMDPNHHNPFTKKKGAPRIYFIRRADWYAHGCKQVLSDIRAARRIEIGQNSDGTKQYGDERDDKIPDHCLDCVRYSIGMRPALGPVDPEPCAEPGHIRLNDYFKIQEQYEYELELDRARQFKGHNKWGA
jgi:phage terminase large subunit